MRSDTRNNRTWATWLVCALGLAEAYEIPVQVVRYELRDAGDGALYKTTWSLGLPRLLLYVLLRRLGVARALWCCRVPRMDTDDVAFNAQLYWEHTFGDGSVTLMPFLNTAWIAPDGRYKGTLAATLCKKVDASAVLNRYATSLWRGFVSMDAGCLARVGALSGLIDCKALRAAREQEDHDDYELWAMDVPTLTEFEYRGREVVSLQQPSDY